jgi:hypothetical protein
MMVIITSSEVRLTALATGLRLGDTKGRDFEELCRYLLEDLGLSPEPVGREPYDMMIYGPGIRMPVETKSSNSPLRVVDVATLPNSVDEMDVGPKLILTNAVVPSQTREAAVAGGWRIVDYRDQDGVISAIRANYHAAYDRLRKSRGKERERRTAELFGHYAIRQAIEALDPLPKRDEAWTAQTQLLEVRQLKGSSGLHAVFQMRLVLGDERETSPLQTRLVRVDLSIGPEDTRVARVATDE